MTISEQIKAKFQNLIDDSNQEMEDGDRRAKNAEQAFIEAKANFERIVCENMATKTINFLLKGILKNSVSEIDEKFNVLPEDILAWVNNKIGKDES